MVTSRWCWAQLAPIACRFHQRADLKEALPMIVLGIVLLIVGIVLNVGILYTLGIILVVVGAVLFLLGSMGHAVGGRSHYW